MLSSQEEIAERKRVLENDRSVREGSTFARFAQSEAEEVRGRFSAISSPQVVGATPIPKYEGAPNWANDPTGIEPPLGLDNPALDPSVVEAEPPPSAPPSEALATPLCPLLPWRLLLRQLPWLVQGAFLIGGANDPRPK